MYDFPISSSSPIFDMLVKWLLEILFNLPFWIYLSFTLFTMCLVPLLSFQINAALDSSLNFWFQSTSSDSKILRWTAPRILMHVQVIWDPSHLKNGAASSSRGVKSKQLKTVSPAHIPTQVGWRIPFTTDSGLSETMTLTTTTIMTVESTLDKLKESHVINNEAGRYNHA